MPFELGLNEPVYDASLTLGRVVFESFDNTFFLPSISELRVELVVLEDLPPPCIFLVYICILLVVHDLLATTAPLVTQDCARSDLPKVDDADPVWDATAHTLAGLCASLVLVASPERIVLSGGVMNRTILYAKVCCAFVAGTQVLISCVC